MLATAVGFGARALGARTSTTAKFYLCVMAILWASNIYGFGSSSIRRIIGDGPAYLPIVHIHAVLFVVWLVLITYQIILVSRGKISFHRRLGKAAILLAALMIPVGITTAFLVDAEKLTRADFAPAFFFLQTVDMLLFGLLVGWAFLARADGGTHKRLMMLSVINLSSAGFARWAPDLIVAQSGASFLGQYLAGNLPVLLLIAAMMLHDMIREPRLHSIWVKVLPIVFAAQLFQTWVVTSLSFNDAARRLLS